MEKKPAVSANNRSMRTVSNYDLKLNDEQLAVVKNGDGPCLVLAGAGSGKTRTIVYRVAYLIEHGVDPRNILLLTFTNKAAKEMLERTEQLLGATLRGLWGGTFHSVSHRILRSTASRIGFRENFSILDQDDARNLIKAVLKDLSIDVKARRFPSPAVVQSIVSYARNARMALADALERKHPRFLPFTTELESIARLFAEKKQEANTMDFDDLLMMFLELLGQNAEIRERLQNQFHYILVDEYQDTNPVQAELVRILSGRHRNILVVGDDAQSIYSFRAADIRNILQFPAVFPDAKTFRLETNYRSTPEILSLANEIISKNRAQFSKTLRPMSQPFEKPQLVAARSQTEQASFIAEMILTLRDEGVKLKDMAVLFRATHHSQQLEFELSKRDIPYEYRGGMKFFERSHIKDVLAFLRVRANSRDQLAWIRILGLQVGIGPAIAGRLAEALASKEEYAAALSVSVDELLSGRARAGWQEIGGTLRALIPVHKPAEAIRIVSQSRNYQDYLEAEYPNWQERLEDLEQLAVFAEATPDMSQFLGEVNLFDDYGAARRQGVTFNGERIVLSTIHQAKGLEWNTVFVMQLTAEDVPNRRAILEEGGIEEERRLFYVAVTRAAKRLFLSYPVSSGYDSLVIQQPSPFLEEVNQELFDDHIFESGHGEAVIELDDQGEEIKPKQPGTYLKDIDELLF